MVSANIRVFMNKEKRSGELALSKLAAKPALSLTINHAGIEKINS